MLIIEMLFSSFNKVTYLFIFTGSVQVSTSVGKRLHRNEVFGEIAGITFHPDTQT